MKLADKLRKILKNLYALYLMGIMNQYLLRIYTHNISQCTTNRLVLYKISNSHYNESHRHSGKVTGITGNVDS